MAKAALVAGTGHPVSTLPIGPVVWIAGVAFATRFGNLVSIVSSIALIAFGAWIAFSSLRELRTGDGHGDVDSHDRANEAILGPNGDDRDGPRSHQHHEDEHAEDESERNDEGLRSRAGTAISEKHTHAHRHAGSMSHFRLHDHGPDTWHRDEVYSVSPRSTNTSTDASRNARCARR